MIPVWNLFTGSKIRIALMLLPILIVFIFFLILPLFVLFRISLYGTDPEAFYAVTKEFTFENYIKSLRPLFFRHLLGSLQLAVFVSSLTFLIGYPTAYFIKRSVKSASNP